MKKDDINKFTTLCSFRYANKDNEGELNMSNKKEKLKDIKLRKRLLRLMKKDFNVAKSKHCPSKYEREEIYNKNKIGVRNVIRAMLWR